MITKIRIAKVENKELGVEWISHGCSVIMYASFLGHKYKPIERMHPSHIYNKRKIISPFKSLSAHFSIIHAIMPLFSLKFTPQIQVWLPRLFLLGPGPDGSIQLQQ